MLCDWVSNYLKPLKNQTKCTSNLNFLAVFESRPMRSLVTTMKRVDIPSCIAVSRYPSYANHCLIRILTSEKRSRLLSMLFQSKKESDTRK